MVGCAAVACKNNSSFKTSNGAESKLLPLLSPSSRFKVKKNVVSQYKNTLSERRKYKGFPFTF